MRILQRRARLPTLITSYWDHGTRRAQLCFSYASSSQPTFDSHSQDCLLSCRVLIKRGLDGSWVLSVNPRVRRGPQTVWDTSLPFCRSMGTAEEQRNLLICCYQPRHLGFWTLLTWAVFFFLCVTRLALQCLVHLVLTTCTRVEYRHEWKPLFRLVEGSRSLPDLGDLEYRWVSVLPVSSDCR